MKQLIEEKSDLEVLRIWIPGCSSGEEVYSIAIIIKELLDETNKHLEVEIFGTDLDENAIKTARSGSYSNVISADISPERLNKFFYKNDNIYTIKNELRDMVVFANHNLIKDPPFTKLDIISCRNLLIYLETDAQEKVLSNFKYALKQDGILFLGPSESIGEFINAFSIVDKKWKIFKCIESNGTIFDKLKFSQVQYQKNSLEYWDSKFDLKDSKHEKVNLNITALAEKKLIDTFVPPSAIINEIGEILYIHGRLGKYIELSHGKAHMNILEMAKEGIRLDLVSAIHNAVSNNKNVVFEGIKFDEDHSNHLIKVTVNPLKEPESVKGLLIVSFERSNIPKDHEVIELDPISENSDKIHALENELKMTKERLNITIEELTTSNEELKSANEELKSMNEESQSTNEELETSKEELQSINEELTTVNNELQIKIDDMTTINDDMTNLLNSTEIATIFVDNDLKIRRFTKEATKLVKLIGSDVGRPLSDIVSNIKYSYLVDDIAQVIERIVFKEIELETEDGEWLQTKIMPYKTSNNVIDGAVITFNNITQRKKQIIDALKLADNIIQTAQNPVLVLDKGMKIYSANQSFYQSYKIKPDETIGKNFFNINNRQWDVPTFRELLEKILPENAQIND